MPAGVKAAVTKIVNVLGRNYEASVDVYADVAPTFDMSLAAAKIGSLTTRTDNDTGELTMSGGHGIATGNRLDVYWINGDGTQGVRYGMTVGTVATNQVPIDGGAGDNLPADETPITAMVPTEQAIVVVGNNVVFLTFSSAQGGVLVYADGSNVNLATVVLDGDPDGWSWTSADGSTSPLAGDSVAKIFLSHGKSNQAVTLRGVIGYN